MVHVLKRLGLLLLIISVLGNGCSSTRATYNSDLGTSYSIDPIFREYYNQKGGKSLLGPGISALFTHGRFKFQYTVAGLLVFDSQTTDQQRISFAPLGQEMSVLRPFWEGYSDPNRQAIVKYPILEEFLPLYEKLGGEAVVGKPLTPPHFNPKQGRYEQLFDSLGFFRLIDDKPGAVKLLSYGVWKCGESCDFPPGISSEIILPEQIEALFIPWVARVGLDFTGYALTNGYEEKAGAISQIYENLILAQDPAHPEQIIAFRLPEKMGIFPDPPRISGEEKDMVFVPVEGEEGYFVPQRFIDYIQRHGGIEISGLPIGDFKPILDKVNQQCFEYICLQEDQRVDGELRIHPAPLGFMYLQMLGVNLQNRVQWTEIAPSETEESSPQSQEMRKGSYLAGEVSLQVWETYPWVSPQQPQEIVVAILINNKPVASLEPYLTVYLPDNEKLVQKMPATGLDGKSTIELSPFKMPNGTLIPYQVCVTLIQPETPVCSEGDFLVWYTPGG
jgi:hypothetical protein